MGPEHPIYRTQYLNETLTAVGRLFSESQLSQITSPQSYPVVEEARELPTEMRRQATNDSVYSEALEAPAPTP